MGGRGASSGISVSGKPYGSEYHTVLESGNIKFLIHQSGSATAPMETMTHGRVYVTIGSDDKPRYITFYDKENKRFKQIDLTGKPHKIDDEPIIPHTHLGYEHSEYGTTKPSDEEREIIERVTKIWERHISTI